MNCLYSTPLSSAAQNARFCTNDLVDVLIEKVQNIGCVTLMKSVIKDGINREQRGGSWLPDINQNLEWTLTDPCLKRILQVLKCRHFLNLSI